MSVVERLAAKWHHEFCCEHVDELDDGDINEARWWLEAVADELEYALERESMYSTLVWLRAQAKEKV